MRINRNLKRRKDIGVIVRGDAGGSTLQRMAEAGDILREESRLGIVMPSEPQGVELIRGTIDERAHARKLFLLEGMAETASVNV